MDERSASQLRLKGQLFLMKNMFPFSGKLNQGGKFPLSFNG